MSTTLFFLVPIGMLGVAWSFCFVGCVFQTHGLGEVTPYSDNILAQASQTGLVAYWPLSDILTTLNVKGQTSVAGDLFDGHNGTYTIPPAYPSGNMSDPITAPSLTRKPSIVPGDAGSIKNPLPASVDFNGGFINIPWSAQNSPQLTEFTVEAWINPDSAGAGFNQALFAAIVPGDATGFVILIVNNQWQLIVGNGATASTFNTGVAVSPGYVAVTFNKTSQALSLWTDLQLSDTPNPPPPTPAWPPPGSPPTNYVAADPSQLTQMFIGAGATEEMLRTVDDGTGGPLFPFVGQIQSVALYSSALSATTIQSNFEIGSPG